MSSRIRRRALAAMLGVLVATAGTAAGALWRGPEPAPGGDPAQTATMLPASETSVVAGTTAGELALGTSRALYQRAPAAVLVGEDDEASLPAAGATAVRLGVPLLVTPTAGATADAGALRAELGRLAVRTVVPVGASATHWARERLPVTGGVPVRIDSAAPDHAAL